MSPLLPTLLLLACFWWGGMARAIDSQIAPSKQRFNGGAHEHPDLHEKDENVVFGTGFFELEALDTVHGLQVVDVQQNTINLTWIEFMPTPIERDGEYVIAVSNSTSLLGGEWVYKYVGRRTHYTLKNLGADETYRLRVAFYAEGGLHNLSEIIIAHTLPVEHCVYRNEIYPVYKYFEYDEEDICICMGSGAFVCAPLVKFAGSVLTAMSSAKMHTL